MQVQETGVESGGARPDCSAIFSLEGHRQLQGKFCRLGHTDLEVTFRKDFRSPSPLRISKIIPPTAAPYLLPKLRSHLIF